MSYIAEINTLNEQIRALRKALAVSPMPRSTARIAHRILADLVKGPRKAADIVHRVHWIGTVYLLERMAVDGMVAISDHGGDPMVALAPHSRLGSDLLAFLERGSVARSILRRKFAKEAHYVDATLKALESTGKVTASHVRNGWRYELVSHTPAAPDASPLVTDSTPV